MITKYVHSNFTSTKFSLTKIHKQKGDKLTVYGQEEPEQSYEHMLKAFEESDIPGLQEFLDE